MLEGMLARKQSNGAFNGGIDVYSILISIGFLIYSPTARWVVGIGVLLAIVFYITKTIVEGQERKRTLAALQEQQHRQIVEYAENQKLRHDDLDLRYGSEIAERIMAGKIWQGMTAEQLVASAGEPEGLDKIVSKRAQKEVWKYGQTTATRFTQRITLENGLVTGWQMHE